MGSPAPAPCGCDRVNLKFCLVGNSKKLAIAQTVLSGLQTGDWSPLGMMIPEYEHHLRGAPVVGKRA